MTKKQPTEPARVPLAEVADSLGYGRDTLKKLALSESIGVLRSGYYFSADEVERIKTILAGRRKYGQRRA